MFKIGIVSTGHIANILAVAIRASETASLGAVSSRHLESAQAFADNHGITQIYSDWRIALEDDF